MTCQNEAADLLSKFLQLDPKKRCTAKEALSHIYFSKPPLPCKKEEIPMPKDK